MLDFASYEILAFDCYGTLIDWETGIWNALLPVFSHYQISINRERALELYAELESVAEREAYRPYRQVLEDVLVGFGRRLGFTPDLAEIRAFPESIQFWPPFTDTIPALRLLQEDYQLAILSNIDDDLFAYSASLLEVPFDVVVTARQVCSYKPSLNNFQHLLERLARPAGKVLHIAQSLYHDIAPAKSLGLATVWVNRRHDQPGFGATPAAQATPDLEVPDLITLANLVKVGK